MAQTSLEIAHLVDFRNLDTIEVLGPSLQFVQAPEEDEAPSLMRGTVPPGVIVPLHSHADPETFIMVSGVLEGLSLSGDHFRWIALQPGDVFHIPGNAKHAFRNQGSEPAVTLIVSTGRIARFFRELGVPAIPGAPPRVPTPEEARRFQELAARYGYWNGTPEENARVGLVLPFV